MKSVVIILLSIIGLNAFAEKVELNILGVDKTPKVPKDAKIEGNGNWAVKETRTGSGNWTIKEAIKTSNEQKVNSTGNWATKSK